MLARNFLRKTSQTKSHPSSSTEQGLAQGVGHYLQNIEEQLRSTVCHASVCYQCKICLKTLCIEGECSEPSPLSGQNTPLSNLHFYKL